MGKKITSSKAFISSNPGINSIFDNSEYISPLEVFQVFFNGGIFKILCDETNRYATQQINKNKKRWPTETQISVSTLKTSHHK
jgi:hypothetical protein